MSGDLTAAVAAVDALMANVAAHAAPDSALGRAGLARSDTLPDWLVAVFERHDAVWAAGRGRACEHFTTARLRVAAAWRPGIVVCPACLPLLEPQTGEDRDCCDACLTAAGARMKPTVCRVVHPSLGVVLMTACLCHPCTDLHRAAVGLA